MDITQPDSGQQQPDDVSGGIDGDSSTPHETEQAPKTFAQDPQTPGPQVQPADRPTDRPQRFAEVLAAVDDVHERPLADHKDVFTRAQRELTDALNDVERGDS